MYFVFFYDQLNPQILFELDPIFVLSFDLFAKPIGFLAIFVEYNETI
jgi:hypothetical protein